MSVSNQMHAAQISRVTTLLDHTDVSVRWDLLQSLSLTVQIIQFVKVRHSPHGKHESLVPLLISASPQVSSQLVNIV